MRGHTAIIFRVTLLAYAALDVGLQTAAMAAAAPSCPGDGPISCLAGADKRALDCDHRCDVAYPGARKQALKAGCKAACENDYVDRKQQCGVAACAVH